MTTIVLSGIGILVALVICTVLVFNKLSPILAGPIAAIICCVFSGLPLYETLLNGYVPGVAGFFTSYFLLFGLSAILGKIYEATGAATKIGEFLAVKLGPSRAILAVLVASAVLTYGGITSFVIIFAVYPIAQVLFQRADIPNRIIPATVCLGTWSFAMTGPASTQIQNVLPMQALGTTSMAGWEIGVPAAIIMAVAGYLYLAHSAKKLKAQGMHFEVGEHTILEDSSEKPGFWVSLLPILVVIVSFNVLGMDILACLLITNILATILFIKYFPEKNFLKVWSDGAAGSIPVIMSVACIVGYGNVSKLTPFFLWFNEILATVEMNAYVLAFALSNAFSAILGSSSGSLGIIFDTFTDTFLRAGEMGYNLDFIHRLASIGSGGLDSLPFNGAMISVLSVCGVTHKQGYKYIWWVNGGIPVIAGFVALAIALVIG